VFEVNDILKAHAVGFKRTLYHLRH